MPDREKVIKVIEGLEHCIVDNNEPCNCPYDGDGGCIGSLMRDALALLKAQEPIAPIQGADDQDEDVFCCGSCGAVVGETFFWPPGEYEVRDNYCSECGRAVKWE